MSENIEPLVLDLVEFVIAEQRSYDAVMDAWRTNCPRMTVWEEAVSRKLVCCERDRAGNSIVIATDQGLRALESAGRKKKTKVAA